MKPTLAGLIVSADFLHTIFAAAEAPTFWHWLIFIAIVAAMIALFFPMINKWQSQRRRKVIHLELRNRGNIRSRYALRAVDPTKNLNINFLLNGTKLHEQLVPIPGARVTVSQTAPAPRQPQRTQPASSGKKKKGGNVIQSASQTAGILSALLTTVGAILPRSMGQSFLRAGAKMRSGRNVATRTQQAGGYAAQLVPGSKGGGSSGYSGGYGTYSGRSSGQTQNYTPQQPASVPASAVPAEKLPANLVETWWQTPFIDANQSIQIEVALLPKNPFKTQHYPITLNSRSVEYDNAPLVTEELSIQLAGLNVFERFAPYILLLTGIIALLIVFLSLW